LVEYDLQSICSWKEVEIQEANIQSDHIHLVCSIIPLLY
jgi:putative transposase